jgi:hypothetical protein
MASILVVMLIISTGLFLINGGVQAVGVQVNVKDLPEHGLKMISPSDPAFNGRMSALLNGKPNAFIERMKPYSVFLVNSGHKTVVAYQLKWEIIRTDGSVVSRKAAYSNPRALMDGGVVGQEKLSVSEGYALRVNSARLISLAFSLDEAQGGTIGGYAGGYADPGKVDQLKQLMRDNNPAAIAAAIAEELETYRSITVSLDGAFFDDGTFVGPDTTQFFAQVQAQLDAKRELLEEIAFALNHKKSHDDIYAGIEEIAKSQDVLITSTASSTDFYRYYKKVYAQEILSMRRAMDANKAIQLALQPLHRRWPRLTKQ